MITTPGKFEGCPDYLPKVWEWVVDGCSDDTIYDTRSERAIDVFLLDSDVRDLVGSHADDDDYAMLVWESEQGFVYHCYVTEQEYADYRTLVEQDAMGDE